jgi:hypothetical protein
MGWCTKDSKCHLIGWSVTCLHLMRRWMFVYVCCDTSFRLGKCPANWSWVQDLMAVSALLAVKTKYLKEVRLFNTMCIVHVYSSLAKLVDSHIKLVCACISNTLSNNFDYFAVMKMRCSLPGDMYAPIYMLFSFDDADMNEKVLVCKIFLSTYNIVLLICNKITLHNWNFFSKRLIVQFTHLRLPTFNVPLFLW